MCEDIADLLDKTRVSKLDVQIAFSSEWNVAPDLARAPVFTVLRRHTELLKAAAVSMRENEEASDTQIIGRIKELDTEGNPSDLLNDVSDRKIVINWLSPDGTVVRVHVLVSPPSYLLACEAHTNGKMVAISGKLKRGRKLWTLEAPGDLRVLD